MIQHTKERLAHPRTHYKQILTLGTSARGSIAPAPHPRYFFRATPSDGVSVRGAQK